MAQARLRQTIHQNTIHRRISCDSLNRIHHQFSCPVIDYLQSLYVQPETTAIQAMRIIDQGSAQIALVVDENQHLLGTLTDGDIRRGLLQGETLDTPVFRLMNRRFRFVSTNDNEKSILEMMRRESLPQIPILNEDGRVVQLLLLKELINPPQLNNTVVIMAGGKGTRLRPHTEHCPKPMLHVDNKPILEILLEQYIARGFYTFYFSVNYLKEQIIDHFDDGSRWGVSIQYLMENEPLGTAGSLKLLPKSVTLPFLVINGDVLTRLDPRQLLKFHNEHQAQATLCVREHALTVPFGVVKSEGVELAGFEEKPTYSHQVNAGVYVIDPKLLTLLPCQQFTDMPNLLLAAKDVGYRVTVCPIHEYWLDVGQLESLRKADCEWPLEKHI